jgi:hypothetical protein
MGKWLKHLLSMAFAKTPDKLLFTESTFAIASAQFFIFKNTIIKFRYLQ